MFLFLFLWVIGWAFVVSAIPQPALAADVGMAPVGGSPTIPVSVSGTVYLDRNHNGKIDDNEFSINGATVKLYSSSDSANPVATVTTDSTGKFSFKNLLPGKYSLFDTTPNQQGAIASVGAITDLNDKKVTDPNVLGSSSSDGSAIKDIVLQSGNTALNYDFGMGAYPIQLVSKRMLLASGGGPASDYKITQVPEPGTVILWLVGGISLGLWKITRRFRRK